MSFMGVFNWFSFCFIFGEVERSARYVLQVMRADNAVVGVSRIVRI